MVCIFLTLPFFLLGTLQRFFFISHLHSHNLISGPTRELFRVYTAGVRFDAMVSGYFAVALMVWGLLWRGRFLRSFQAFLLILSAVIFSAELSFFDQFFDRWTSGQLSKGQFDTRTLLFSFGIQVLPSAPLIFLVGLGSPKAFFFQRLWLRSLVVLFLCALAIRGSLGPHHLDLRHSEVTSKEMLNLASLNTWYALDQALRGRR